MSLGDANAHEQIRRGPSVLWGVEISYYSKIYYSFGFDSAARRGMSKLSRTTPTGQFHHQNGEAEPVRKPYNSCRWLKSAVSRETIGCRSL